MNLKQKKLREEYVSRINRVVDYIENNVNETLSLEKLSKVASFSRFHFHRIFKSLIGETLNAFIQRVRLERAASQLLMNYKKSITEVAFDCGFSGSAQFSRSFRDFFKISPSEWRVKEFKDNSKNCKTKSKNSHPKSKKRKDKNSSSLYYIDKKNQLTQWRKINMDSKKLTVQVKTMPGLNVVYVRHIGPYKGNSKLFESLFMRLMKWAGPRDLLKFPETKVLCVYHDDPKITEEQKLRVSACITVPENTKVDGEVGKMTISGGKYAVARFELKSNEYEDAWNSVFGEWLPESGYQPDDGACYELYHNDPEEHPEKKCIVDICVPVKPL